MAEGIWRGFASDNYAGVHPEVLAEIAAVNLGHQPAYGADSTTAELQQLVRRHFGASAEAFPVFNGTGANVTALQGMTRSWEAVICTSSAHIHADEGGAPEKVAGLKLWTVESPDGKLTPRLVETQVFDRGFVHRAQPAVVYLSQSTELGTVYTPAELLALTEHAHAAGMKVLMDGARLSNAAVSLGLPFRAFTTDVGVDAVTLGLTKNGALAAESVVALHPDAVPGFEFIRKSAMQLASKMRYVSAQQVAMLRDDLWSRCAAHANGMAQRLAAAVAELPGVQITQSVDANAVFAVLPAAATAALQEEFHFYTWDETSGEVRWMCSWDTTAQDVDRFAAAVRTACGG